MSSSNLNLNEFIIPLKEIEEAYKDSPQVIGSGGYGEVFRGKLSQRRGNHEVAIKLVKKRDDVTEDDFYNEVELLASLKHENIISFVGYCDEKGKKYIVSDYASNESLEKHLEEKKELTWELRLRICHGVARGLKYLHSDLEKIVLHRDLKSGNILLDENLVPKICDFGLSREGNRDEGQSGVYTMAKGTPVYMDPAFYETRKYIREYDIYSFGVLMIEILSGKLAHEIWVIGDGMEMTLVDAVRNHHGHPEAFIDEQIRDQIYRRSLEVYFAVAVGCLVREPKDRHNVQTIVDELKKALDSQVYEMDSTTKWIKDLEIPLEDIKMATEDFGHENFVGVGRYGKVYKGTLPESRIVTMREALSRATGIP